MISIAVSTHKIDINRSCTAQILLTGKINSVITNPISNAVNISLLKLSPKEEIFYMKDDEIQSQRKIQDCRIWPIGSASFWAMIPHHMHC